MKELLEYTACELSRALRSRDIKSADVTAAYLKSIERQNGEINAYLSVFEDGAMDAARESDKRLDGGAPLSPLDGVPVAVKDNIMLSGRECTCASRMLKGFIAPYDATVITRLREAGMPILGKLNMDEFAMGGSNENSAFGPVKNPRDTSRVPGGSSGGAAAAVAARMAPLALGSDTGGSIRQPAAFCGVVGAKPRYGEVSRYGLVAFASSLDQIGPLARTARDAAMLMDVIAGNDPRDMTSLKERPETYVGAMDSLKGVRLGVIGECFGEGLRGDVRRAVTRAISRLKALGAGVEPVSLPSLPLALPAYYVISSAEASSNLARYDGVRYGHRAEKYEGLEDMYRRSRMEGFGEEVKRRVLLGTFALSSGYQDRYYLRAQAVRELLRREMEEALAKCDALISPVTPTPAYKLREKLGDPMEMYMGDIYTVPANITGMAALSAPCGGDGLPIGFSLMGARLKPLLSIADVYERGAKI